MVQALPRARRIGRGLPRREALTRALGRLRKAGAVEIKNRHIYVTDVDALSRVAEIGR